jgi:cellulose biosynthesis protein BcsQ
MNKMGRVVTFYSYKGGTGRTMALANVAWILATNGHRVLTIDWDLEAPGLHRFFAPLLMDRTQSESEGLIDALLEYVVAATRPQPTRSDTPGEAPWYDTYANLLRFTQPLDLELGQGRLDLISAGRQGPDYAARVNTFDWRSFYDKFAGRAFLDRAFAKLREQYDYILIDSRTGVSDTAGICTVQLPDALVVCFTLNNQSIEGATAIARDALRQRSGELPIYPVPTRVEFAEFDRLQAARGLVRSRLGDVIARLEGSRDDYLDSVQVKHVPFYAFEEQLATIVEADGSPALLKSYERLTWYVSDRKVESLGRLPPARIEALRVAYRREEATVSDAIAPTSASPRGAPKYDLFFLNQPREEGLVEALRRQLEPLTKTYSPATIRPGEMWRDVSDTVLVASRAVVVVIPENWSDKEWINNAIARALNEKIRVIPLLIGRAEAPPSLRDFQALRIDPRDDRALPRVAEQLRGALLESASTGVDAREYAALLQGEVSALRRGQRTWTVVALASFLAMIAGVAFAYVSTSESVGQLSDCAATGLECRQLLASAAERYMDESSAAQTTTLEEFEEIIAIVEWARPLQGEQHDEGLLALQQSAALAAQLTHETWKKQLEDQRNRCKSLDYAACHALGYFYLLHGDERENARAYLKQACDQGKLERSCNYLQSIPRNEGKTSPTPGIQPSVPPGSDASPGDTLAPGHVNDSTPPRASRSTVYIHVSRDEQLDGALQIRQLLSQSFYTADVQLVRENQATPKRLALVKYFHRSDQRDAQAVVKMLRGQDIAASAVEVVPADGGPPTVPQGRIMLWFTPKDLL